MRFLTDTGFFRDSRATVAFVAAPALIMAFGIQAVEAVLDIVRGRNSLPIFHRIGWWLDRRGVWLAAIYLLIMIATLALVR